MLSEQYDGSHTVLTSVELPPAVQFLGCAISGRGSAPRTLAWQGPVGNLGPAGAMLVRVVETQRSAYSMAFFEDSLSVSINASATVGYST
jgi:hypothetical protein